MIVRAFPTVYFTALGVCCLLAGTQAAASGYPVISAVFWLLTMAAALSAEGRRPVGVRA